ncbi:MULTISPECIES: hypothetical protein [unclassified Bradyrhizobium]|uniref:hypothetical protein n=1 Tax=Bradyrhizobium TaxID=374 RepID=UPI0028E81DE8|nr:MULTISPECIES: hypothetical protein [unclassified Bradyrhizobium]
MADPDASGDVVAEASDTSFSCNDSPSWSAVSVGKGIARAQDQDGCAAVRTDVRLTAGRCVRKQPHRHHPPSISIRSCERWRRSKKNF